MPILPSQPVKDSETSFSLFNWLRNLWLWIKPVSDTITVDTSTSPYSLTVNGTLTVSNTSYLTGETYLYNNTNLLSGNFDLNSTAQRITGNFSTSTIADRCAIQSNVTNGNTGLMVLPNGTSVSSAVVATNQSTPTNSNFCRIQVNATEARLDSGLFGTGSSGTTTYFPLNFYTSATLRFTIDPSGNVIVGTAALATTDTAGFLWIPSCAGTPTGSPTAPYSNAGALIVDTTNNRLYVRVGSTWKYATLT